MKTAYEVWSAPRGPVASGPVTVTWDLSAAHADDEPWLPVAKPVAVWNAAAKQREALLHGDWRNVMAKAWGNARGYKANKGSWIENEFGNSTGCQGWSSFYRKFYCKIWKSIQEEVK